MALEKRDSFEIYSEFVAKAIIGGETAFIVQDSELIDLYLNINNTAFKRCIEHEVTNNRMHLAYQIGLDIPLTWKGNEALFTDRKRALIQFEKVKSNQIWKNYFPESYEEALIQFNQIFKELQKFLLNQKDFRHKTAEIGLRFIKRRE